ncbi:MAG: hypothetical protein C4323_14830 [Mastigocladus sp. ERB_26_2]
MLIKINLWTIAKKPYIASSNSQSYVILDFRFWIGSVCQKAISVISNNTKYPNSVSFVLTNQYTPKNKDCKSHIENYSQPFLGTTKRVIHFLRFITK